MTTFYKIVLLAQTLAILYLWGAAIGDRKAWHEQVQFDKIIVDAVSPPVPE